jgi:hypothetical protein
MENKEGLFHGIESVLVTEKESYKKHLALLNKRYSESLGRDKEKNNPKEISTRESLDIVKLETQNRILEIDAELKKINGNKDIPEGYQDSNFNNSIDPNQLNIKNMGEKSVEDAYKREFKSTEEGDSDIYEGINNKNKFNKAYEDDFKDREKTLSDDTDELEKKRTEKNEEEEKIRAAKKKIETDLKEEEERIDAYKRQFTEKDDDSANSNDSVKNVDVPVDTPPIDNPPINTETELQKIIRERNENMPHHIDDDSIDTDLEERANAMAERMKKDALEKYPELADVLENEKKPIQELLDAKEVENAELIEKVEDLSEQLSKMVEMADNTIIEITAEEDKEKAHKTLRAIGKFIRSPKGQMAILAGVGAMAFTAGGGAVPAIMLLKPMLVKAGIISAGYTIPYAYGLSSGISAAFAGGAAGGVAEKFLKKIGLVKDKKDNREIVKEFAFGVKDAAGNENINRETPAENILPVAGPENIKLTKEEQQSKILGQFDVIYEKALNKNEYSDEEIFAYFDNIDDYTKEKGFGTEFTDPIYNQIATSGKYDRTIVKKMIDVREKYKKDALSTPNSGEDSKQRDLRVKNIKAVLRGEGEKKTIETEKENKGGDYEDQLRKYFSNMKEELKKDTDHINGEMVFNVAQFLKESSVLAGEGNRITNRVFMEIFPEDDSMRGKMVDAMAVYADSKGMKGKDIARYYLSFFETNHHIGRGDVYLWLSGNKDRLVENINKTEVAKKPETLNEQIQIFEAKKKVFEIGQIITKSDKEGADTNVLKKLEIAVKDELENKNNHEIVAPVAELIRSLAENKVKFEFLKKGSPVGDRDSGQGEKIVSEIKNYILVMEKNGKFGAEAPVRERNKKLIVDLIDSEEFKSKI